MFSWGKGTGSFKQEIYIKLYNRISLWGNIFLLGVLMYNRISLWGNIFLLGALYNRISIWGNIFLLGALMYDITKIERINLPFCIKKDRIYFKECLCTN